MACSYFSSNAVLYIPPAGLHFPVRREKVKVRGVYCVKEGLLPSDSGGDGHLGRCYRDRRIILFRRTGNYHRGFGHLAHAVHYVADGERGTETARELGWCCAWGAGLALRFVEGGVSDWLLAVRIVSTLPFSTQD